MNDQPKNDGTERRFPRRLLLMSPGAAVTAVAAELLIQDRWWTQDSRCRGRSPALPTPSPDADFNRLSAVTAVSASDGWAVGQFFASSGVNPLVLRWDGNQWAQKAAHPGVTLMACQGMGNRIGLSVMGPAVMGLPGTVRCYRGGDEVRAACSTTRRVSAA
jgi:hypothetical protein